MNILVFGIIPSPVNPILREYECSVFEWEDPINVELLRAWAIDFAVSYRYRYIVRKPIIDYLRGNVINLHISLLPWNRGADPNLWSFLEDTPKGVTIHYIDEGIDTGDIVAQKKIVFNKHGETLATTYETLNSEIIRLFHHQWPLIAAGKAARKKQPPGGSFHQLKDKEDFMHLLGKDGWNTPIEKVRGRALIQSRT